MEPLKGGVVAGDIPAFDPGRLIRQMSKMVSGESQNNVTGHIGGDSSLTKRGHSYGKMLGEYVRQLPHPK